MHNHVSFCLCNVTFLQIKVFESFKSGAFALGWLHTQTQQPPVAASSLRSHQSLMLRLEPETLTLLSPFCSFFPHISASSKLDWLIHLFVGPILIKGVKKWDVGAGSGGRPHSAVHQTLLTPPYFLLCFVPRQMKAMPPGYWNMTNQREPGRKAIRHNVRDDNCVFSAASQAGECFVRTLKCACVSCLYISFLSVLVCDTARFGIDQILCKYQG